MAGAAALAAVFFAVVFAAAGALSVKQAAVETAADEKKRGSHADNDQQQLHIHEFHLCLTCPCRRAGMRSLRSRVGTDGQERGGVGRRLSVMTEVWLL